MRDFVIEFLQHVPRAALLVTIPLLVAVVLARVLRKRPSFERSVVWKIAIAAALVLPIVTLATRSTVPAPGVNFVRLSSGPPEVPTWVAVTAGVWLGVALLLAMRAVLGRLALRRDVRLAVPASRMGAAELACLSATLGVSNVALRVVGDRPACTFGWLHPIVVVPARSAAWRQKEWRLALTHELLHVRRRDYLDHLAGEALFCLWWFHPLVWAARTRAEYERERACDEAVLGRGEAPAEYAEFLLREAAVDSLPAIGASIGRGSVRQVKRRIVAVAAGATALPSRLVMVASGLLTGAVAVGATAVPQARALAPKRPIEIELPAGGSVLTNNPTLARKLREHGLTALQQLPGTRRFAVEMSFGDLDAMRRGDSVVLPFGSTKPIEEKSR